MKIKIEMSRENHPLTYCSINDNLTADADFDAMEAIAVIKALVKAYNINVRTQILED